jgi:hypothetical protein
MPKIPTTEPVISKEANQGENLKAEEEKKKFDPIVAE